MSTTFTFLLLLWLSSNASLFAPEKMSITYTETGEPAIGIAVERGRDYNTIEKIFNPIGTFYFPIKTVKSCFTDKNGEAMFYMTQKNEMYRVSTTEKRRLTVKMKEKEFQFEPDKKQPDAIKWDYDIWFKDGKVETNRWGRLPQEVQSEEKEKENEKETEIATPVCGKICLTLAIILVILIGAYSIGYWISVRQK